MFWRHFQETLRKEKVFAKHRQTSSNPIASFQLLLFLFPPQTKPQQVILLAWLQLNFHDYFIPEVWAVLKGGGWGGPFLLLHLPKATCVLAAVCNLFGSAGSQIREPIQLKISFPSPSPSLRLAPPALHGWMTSNVSTRKGWGYATGWTTERRNWGFHHSPPTPPAKANTQFWPESKSGVLVSVSLKNCSKMSGD